MKNIYKIIPLIVLVSISISGCGIGIMKKDADVDKRTLAEEGFDPLAGIDDKDIITSSVPMVNERDTLKEMPALPERQETSEKDDSYFSVQLFASKSDHEAREFMNSVTRTFDGDIRIDYLAPYYRVCVGRAEGFENGEQLLKHVSSMGFPRAWLVRIRE